MCLTAIAGYERKQADEEASVVAAAQSGDHGAFSILAANYRNSILNRVRRITGNLEDAEDVTQQALMKAFMSVATFRGMSSFSSWLTRIAINEALMLKRKPRSRAEISWSNFSMEDGGIEMADRRPNPEQCFDSRERRQILMAAIRALPPTSRVAVESCLLDEKSLKDLALIQGSSLPAVKSRLFRSRHSLRAKISRSLRAEASGRRPQLSVQSA